MSDNVLKFPVRTTEGLFNHTEICVLGDAVHTTFDCKPLSGQEEAFAKWHATELEIEREQYFLLNVLQQPDRAAWIERLPEPDKSTIVGNLRSAFNDGWLARGTSDRQWTKQAKP